MTFQHAVILAAVLVIATVVTAFLVFSSTRAEKVEQKNKEMAKAAAEGQAVETRRSNTPFGRMLTEAGIDLDPKVFAIGAATLVVLIAVLGYLLGGLIVGLVALALSAVLVWFWVVRRRRARKGAFEEQLCEALPMIAEGIRSGMTFERAAQNAASFMDDPFSAQFKRMALERSYGTPLPEAVNNIAKRTGSRDMVELATVVDINTQTGGNMAGIIDSVAKNMQSRARLRRHVKSVTANGRISKTIVTSIPIVLFVVFFIVSRSYIMTMFSSPVGIALLILSAVMLLIGNLIIKKMYNIRIY